MSEDNANLDHYAQIAGTVADAWARCLPLWRPRGRVEDLPRDVRRMMYRVSEEKLLGKAFAARFRDQYAFVVGKLSGPDPVEAACALDVLKYIFEAWRDGPDPAEVVSEPIPAWVREELGGEFYESFRGSTLGDLFRFERDGP